MAFQSEADYQEALAKYLASTGWDVELEKQILKNGRIAGRIDIFACRGNASLVIEAKRSFYSVKDAIKQLKYHGTFFPTASLWFACPERLNSHVVQKLISQGITPIPTAALNLESYKDLDVEGIKGRVYRHGVCYAPVSPKPAEPKEFLVSEYLLKEMQRRADEFVKRKKCRACNQRLLFDSYELIYADRRVGQYKITLKCARQECIADNHLIIQRNA